MAEDSSVATGDIRKGFYADGLTLRSGVLALLNKAREVKVRPWTFRRKQLRVLETEYAVLFERFVAQDRLVSEYMFQATNPWCDRMQPYFMNPNTSFLLEFGFISAHGLASQHESSRMLLKDVAGQLANVNSRIGNNLAVGIALLALIASVILSACSIVFSYLSYVGTDPSIPPVP